MITKRIKIEPTTCCVCNQIGYSGFTDTFNVFLRENQTAMSFADVVNFTLGIKVSKDLSTICEKCKIKVIEFYNFKKQAQSNRGQTMIQEIMKIVSSFTAKNNLIAVTIEESSDKLVIMEKSSSPARAEASNSKNLIITNVFENVDFKVEKDDEYTEQNAEGINNNKIKNEKLTEGTNNFCNIKIKTEKPDDESDMVESYPMSQNYEDQFTNGTSVESEGKLDLILGLNREILKLVKRLNGEQNIESGSTTNI